MDELEKIKKQILELVEQYAKEDLKEKPFIGGITHIPVTGKVIDEVGSSKIRTFAPKYIALDIAKHCLSPPDIS